MRAKSRFYLFFPMLVLLAVQPQAAEAPIGPAAVIARRVDLRAGPGSDQPVLARLRKRDKVAVVGRTYGWYKVNVEDGSSGWVAEEHLKLSLDGQVRRWTRARRVLTTAQSLLGCKYVHGKEGPRTFDCSGLVKYVYARVRVDLPRTAGAQMRAGRPVSRGELAPGDLVFFATDGDGRVSHVGIYLFAGEFIHASSGRGFVTTSTLNQGYYQRTYVGAARVL